ncbi:hypothetical protein Tco_0576161 [Tanacetum coccineum]
MMSTAGSKDFIPWWNPLGLVAKATNEDGVLRQQKEWGIVTSKLSTSLVNKVIGQSARRDCRQRHCQRREPLELLHMDLFGPVSVESYKQGKSTALVVTVGLQQFSSGGLSWLQGLLKHMIAFLIGLKSRENIALPGLHSKMVLQKERIGLYWNAARTIKGFLESIKEHKERFHDGIHVNFLEIPGESKGRRKRSLAKLICDQRIVLKRGKKEENISIAKEKNMLTVLSLYSTDNTPPQNGIVSKKVHFCWQITEEGICQYRLQRFEDPAPCPNKVTDMDIEEGLLINSVSSKKDRRDIHVGTVCKHFKSSKGSHYLLVKYGSFSQHDFGVVAKTAQNAGFLSNHRLSTLAVAPLIILCWFRSDITGPFGFNNFGGYRFSTRATKFRRRFRHPFFDDTADQDDCSVYQIWKRKGDETEEEKEAATFRPTPRQFMVMDLKRTIKAACEVLGFISRPRGLQAIPNGSHTISTSNSQSSTDTQAGGMQKNEGKKEDQEEWEIIRWRFHESSGVHTLEIEDGTMIHMLAERRYPLSRELMIRMLEHGMEVEDESETAITLIHLFILWTNRRW